MLILSDGSEVAAAGSDLDGSAYTSSVRESHSGHLRAA